MVLLYLFAVHFDFAVHAELSSGIDGWTKVGAKDDKVQASLEFSIGQDLHRRVRVFRRAIVDCRQLGIEELGFELAFRDFVAMVCSCFSFGNPLLLKQCQIRKRAQFFGGEIVQVVLVPGHAHESPR